MEHSRSLTPIMVEDAVTYDGDVRIEIPQVNVDARHVIMANCGFTMAIVKLSIALLLCGAVVFRRVSMAWRERFDKLGPMFLVIPLVVAYMYVEFVSGITGTMNTIGNTLAYCL